LVSRQDVLAGDLEAEKTGSWWPVFLWTGFSDK